MVLFYTYDNVKFVQSKKRIIAFSRNYFETFK